MCHSQYTLYAKYSVGHKNCTFLQLDIIILSLLHSHMNCRKSWNKIYHLISNMLPHYLAKIECSNVQLYSMLVNASVMQNRQFTEFVYQVY